MITFEYPLNEKARNYLRFEFLFSQAKESIDLNNKNDQMVYFKALFELLDLHERCDIRMDLVKDLRMLNEKLNLWLTFPKADKEAISLLIDDVTRLTDAVQMLPKQMRFYKTNRFLVSLKQRFFITGGICNFDLPQFHYWLDKDVEIRKADLKEWFSKFLILEEALTLFFKLTRSEGSVTEQVAEKGTFQAEIKKCNFLMLKLDQSLEVYPVISGHKQRFSVRFLSANDDPNIPPYIPFQQICC